MCSGDHFLLSWIFPFLLWCPSYVLSHYQVLARFLFFLFFYLGWSEKVGSLLKKMKEKTVYSCMALGYSFVRQLFGVRIMFLIFHGFKYVPGVLGWYVFCGWLALCVSKLVYILG